MSAVSLSTVSEPVVEINGSVNTLVKHEIGKISESATDNGTNDHHNNNGDKDETVRKEANEMATVSLDEGFKIPVGRKKLKEVPSKEDKMTDINSKARENKLTILDNGPKSCSIVATTTSLQYEEPNWSGCTNKSYKFEVIKGGVHIDTIDLKSKPFYVVGRLPTSDIVLEHPSISRHHAIVQYRMKGNDEFSEGFYLYDLHSTHGTTINKQQLRPRLYTRILVGYVIKFGGSSRLFILQGVEDEVIEPQLKIFELRRVQERIKQTESAEKFNADKYEENPTGVDWGLGEEALEDDEDEISEINPFALDTVAPNEDFYIEDPKKTLRGWFEREGYDLEYKIEERGYSHFLCSIR